MYKCGHFRERDPQPQCARTMCGKYEIKRWVIRKMMKKRISVLLALVLALALVPVPAFAAGTTLTVDAPDTLPEKGETFTVTVDISGNPGLCAAQYTLTFNKSVVRCESVTLGSVLEGMLSATNPDAEKGAIVACASPDAKSGDGTLSEYTFKVLRSGEADFALIDGVFTDDAGKHIATNVKMPVVTQPTTPTQPSTPTQPTTPTTPATPAQPEQPTGAEEGMAMLYSDVAQHWGAEYIEKAVAKGLFNGYPDGTFHPDDTISRADFVTVLWRCAGSPEPKGSAAFNDVPADAYYAKAVAWAKGSGYADGVSATAFDPKGALQRQAAMKILYYYNGGVSGLEGMLAAQYDAAFADSGEIAAWAKAPMYWAYYNKIISGTGEGTLSPCTSTTRAQMAKILVNYLETK